MNSSKMTGAQALVRSLKSQGIDTLFGLPGVQLDHVFDALYEERGSIRVLQSRHEQGAGYMAYGYAESTGRLGAFLVVPGPGLLNAATAICTAHASNAPVLALTGQIATRFIGKGLGILHELADPPGMLAPITKRAVFAKSPSEVPRALSDAVRAAISGRQGPVLFEIPEDATSQSEEVVLSEKAVADAVADPESSAVERAAAILSAARKPAIFAGGGTLGAEKELLELARVLEAPVIMTRHGRGAVSDRDYHAQNLVGGHELWGDADAVVAVGTRFLESLGWGMQGIKCIRIDLDAVQAAKPQEADVTLLTSAKKGLQALVAALGRKPRESREAELKALKQRSLDKWAVLQPQKTYSDAIRAVLPEDGIAVAEITQIGFYGWIGYPMHAPRTVIYPGYQDSLGYGYATSLGVKVAHPDKPVVAICGDGGFMFTMQELATAVQHGINVVAIVFNDGAFGNVRRTQKLQFGERYIGSELKNPDFVAMAKAFGAVGMKANSAEELLRILPEALKANAPVIIDAPVPPMPGWQALMPRGPAARVKQQP